MRRFLTIFILILSVCAVVSAQRRTPLRVKLNKNKSSVYISFVRVGKPKSPSDDQSREFVWLRLNNNTRWAIGIDASGENNKESDASLYYNILNEDGAVLENNQCHVCSRNFLGSGKSLVFSIPKADFPEKSYLEIRFSFEWQSDDGSSFAAQDEYENIVSFSERDVPKDAPKEYRTVEQINGREGETATFIWRSSVSPTLRVIGFAPRHFNRSAASVIWSEAF